VGRLHAEDLESLVRRRVDVAALAVVERAAATVGPPLLAVGVVGDVAELDRVHVVAARDRDRDAVERHLALGVERAVDRVDHQTPGSAAADLDQAALLRHHAHAHAEALELGEDRFLHRRVDRERHVAALAPAHPL
jgi:hypothetical protein